MPERPIVYHIPVCPFSQRLEILLDLKRQPDAVEFRVVDITRPRDPVLLQKTRGTTALPVLEAPDGRILKESLVLLAYLDETIPAGMVRRPDPFEHAIESMLIAKEGPFTTTGYGLVLNQDRAARQAMVDKLLGIYRELNEFLVHQNPSGPFLFDRFGLAETVFTPMFNRFWFLEYYEDFRLPAGSDYDRVRVWREACQAHPSTQQVSREEIVKLYYDYSLGAGNGALPDGRKVSSFAFQPDWRDRPWPPKAKYEHFATDAELGLV